MNHLLETGRDASLSASAASDATVQTARMGASPQRMHTLNTGSGLCCDGQSGLEPAMAERGKSRRKGHESELVEVIRAVVSRDTKPELAKAAWAECQIGYEAILAKADWRSTGDLSPKVTKGHDDDCPDQRPKPPKSTMARTAGTPESLPRETEGGDYGVRRVRASNRTATNDRPHAKAARPRRGLSELFGHRPAGRTVASFKKTVK